MLCRCHFFPNINILPHDCRTVRWLCVHRSYYFVVNWSGFKAHRCVIRFGTSVSLFPNVNRANTIPLSLSCSLSLFLFLYDLQPHSFAGSFLFHLLYASIYRAVFKLKSMKRFPFGILRNVHFFIFKPFQQTIRICFLLTLRKMFHTYSWGVTILSVAVCHLQNMI